MHSIKFICAVLLAGGMAWSAPPEDNSKTASLSAPKTPAVSPEPAKTRPAVALPPVLQTGEKDDTTFVVLPGAETPPAPPPVPKPPEAAAKLPVPGPAPLPAEDLERPKLRRADPPYPNELATESALFCQKQIGNWTLEEALAVLGDPRRERASLDDHGAENGDIYAFTDPSSRYREIELDFDRDGGKLRTVFAYPWKMTWAECRKVWGTHVSAADAEKGRMFYSYLDRRLDVLVDVGGRVISLGLY